ncbi:MAG TPA: bifunctional 3'-5' exonuclease/DNA polymerase [Micromonosporaceae bacterium]
MMRLTDDGQSAGPVEPVPDVVDAIQRADGPKVRWLWPSTAELYPTLLRAGVRVARCHDLELVGALLLGAEGDWGAPRALPAVWARLTGAEVPPDPVVQAAAPPGEVQDALFDAVQPAAEPAGFDAMAALREGYVAQLKRIETLAAPGRFRLLVAAESAGALLAAEMGFDGLPLSEAAHEELLLELLGPPSPVGGNPRKLVELSTEISAAFGGAKVRPDSPAEVLKAFQRAGYPIASTASWELRHVNHPAVPLLRRYKELYRIWTAHGWSWRSTWVRGGRFHAEYVPAGVVSGRWASRGGGALQIPRVIRGAVRSDPGWRLVVADAGQLEPRILAAVSGDPGMMRAAGAGDMYAALATDAFAGDRAQAKVALLGAMYGQVGGAAAPALATLRHSYPIALSYVEEAARTGESGGLVRSWLGRTCPPPSVSWQSWTGERPDQIEDVEDRSTGARARARGRFTRNFVIQATAAEWALALLASLRTALAGSPARIVFFQHDEVIVHAPEECATWAASAITAAGESATRLLFGDTTVAFPMGTAIVESYADAK